MNHSGTAGRRGQRRWMASAALWLVLGGSHNPVAAAAADQEGLLGIARLHYDGGGDWYCDPSSLPNWLELMRTRVGVSTEERDHVVTLDSEDLYRYPLLYMSGHGRVALSDEEAVQLRGYLDAGGFLYADDNYGMDASFRAMVAQVFPDEQLVPLPAGHPIYHAYYDLPGLPKIHRHDGEPAQGFGVVRRGRLVLFYSYSSDIGDGLEDPDVHGDPAPVREAAARMAVNVMMYALTHP
ncbi:DUF4159 domain-containing protein [bacterium]|nr:DUF4159 domain-containing protein [bacterium]PIV81746.1 MAG: hypothetical protein COW53_02710 [bacterium CG17_big_fil_post_rev_8_21_14_2_50_64_8]PJA73695.1 MAG: hypothetical protein CO151_12325 [bacterium CG_4_9_14_3_um_filter_65_15]